MKTNTLNISIIVAVLWGMALNTAYADEQRRGSKVDKSDAPRQLGATPKPTRPGLLLPAVQAAPPLNKQPTGMRATDGGRNNPSQAGETTCEGVGSCNDMIATCISLGGNVTATQYDPDSGAPSGATCYSPGG